MAAENIYAEAVSSKAMNLRLVEGRKALSSTMDKSARG